MFKLAALTSQILLATVQVDSDGYIQALPDGQFSAVDGRPADVASGKWLMDATAFAALKANTPHQNGDLVIDYEHQTLNVEKNGQPAPAAGFFHISDVQYREGQGLFIKPAFTDNAQAHLTAKEYKYFSLVFGYDTTTGRPSYIHSGALTNRPGVDGMLPLAALSAELNTQFKPSLNTKTQQKDTPVNEILIALLAKLGIEIGADTEITDAQAQAALTALNELNVEASKVEGLNTQLVALSATNGKQVNLAEYTPNNVVNQLRTQLVSLTAQNGALTIEQTVKQAMDDGKVFEFEKDYLHDLGKQQGMAALSAHLDARSPIAALTAGQTSTVQKPADTKDPIAALTADEIKMADAWGTSHADFAKAKKEQA